MADLTAGEGLQAEKEMTCYVKERSEGPPGAPSSPPACTPGIHPHLHSFQHPRPLPRERHTEEWGAGCQRPHLGAQCPSPSPPSRFVLLPEHGVWLGAPGIGQTPVLSPDPLRRDSARGGLHVTSISVNGYNYNKGLNDP